MLQLALRKRLKKNFIFFILRATRVCELSLLRQGFQLFKQMFGFRSNTLCKPNACSHEKLCKVIMLTKMRRATPARAPVNYVNFLVSRFDLGLHNRLPQEKQILLCFIYHFEYTCYCYYCHYYKCPSISFHKLL